MCISAGDKNCLERNHLTTTKYANTLQSIIQLHAPHTPPAPSSAPADITITPFSTNITVEWGPVDCRERNGAITEYSVRYGNVTVRVSGDASGGMFTITGLMPSTTYSIEVAAVNGEHIGPYSTAVDQLTKGVCVYRTLLNLVYICFILALVAVPVLTVGSTTFTSISLSWTSGGSEGVSYEVEWERDASVGCTDEDTGSTTITGGSMTSYTITDLQEDSRYAVTVTASNIHGDEPSNQITAMTMVAGEQ